MELKELIEIVGNFLEEHKENEDIKSQRNTLYCSLMLIKGGNMEDIFDEEGEEESDDVTEEDLLEDAEEEE